MIDGTLIFTAIAILTALAFDYTNGFHDAANSIATIVSTRVLTPKQAVVWAAIFNFVAFFIFSTAVASTIGRGMVKIEAVDGTVIFVGLLGTIAWNLFTWYAGIPTSSSHALIGGYAGAAIAKAGFDVIIASGWYKTVIFIVIAPMLGLICGYFFISIIKLIVRNVHPTKANKWFRRIQFLSAALNSLGHGGNDAQKTMGIITTLLFTAGYIPTFHIPLWVVLSAHTAIALGTLTGGWKIVATMGQRITKIGPVEGVSADLASAMSIFFATFLGIPVSTTHVITGAISGVGSAKRLSAVRWGVTLKIVWAWVLTIPLSGLMSFVFYHIYQLFK